MSNLADNRVATEALGANAHPLRRAVGERDANVLKVRHEGTTGDARDLRTNALQVFSATARLNFITNNLTFTANFTNSRHDSSYTVSIGRCHSALILR